MLLLQNILDSSDMYHKLKYMQIEDLLHEYPDFSYVNETTNPIQFKVYGYMGRSTVESFLFFKDSKYLDSITTKFICHSYNSKDYKHYARESLFDDYKKFTEMDSATWFEYCSTLGIVPKEMFSEKNDFQNFTNYSDCKPDRTRGIEFAIEHNIDRLIAISISPTSF